MDGHSHARAAAVEVVRRLRAEGHVAYFAGGCVRDELLGLAPEDYDVATDARAEGVRRAFRTVNEVGAAFGVMLVRVSGVQVEVATFREEAGYSDKRRPDRVEHSTSDRDAQRRDFTINALFLDPLETPAADPAAAAAARVVEVGGGRVIDYVGGLGDLEGKVIRAVGDPNDRLAEDHLRALRAVRFAARLGPRGFRLEEATARAVREHARELAGVSRERIGQELRRMFAEPTWAEAAALMDRLDLAAPVLMEPEGEGWGGLAVGGRVREVLGPIGGDEVVRLAAKLTAWVIDRWPGAASAENLAGLGDALVRRLRTALCLTNEERDALRAVVEGVAWLERAWSAADVASQKRAAGSRWFAGATAVAAARDHELGVSVARRTRELEEDGVGLRPAPLVTGDDLVRLGFEAGPRFGRVLEEVYDAQLSGVLRTREEALEELARLARGG